MALIGRSSMVVDRNRPRTSIARGSCQPYYRRQWRPIRKLRRQVLALQIWRHLSNPMDSYSSILAGGRRSAPPATSRKNLPSVLLCRARRAALQSRGVSLAAGQRQGLPGDRRERVSVRPDPRSCTARWLAAVLPPGSRMKNGDRVSGHHGSESDHGLALFFLLDSHFGGSEADRGQRGPGDQRISARSIPTCNTWLR